MKRGKYGNLIRWRAWGIVLVIFMAGAGLILAAFIRPDMEAPAFQAEESGPETENDADTAAVPAQEPASEDPGFLTDDAAEEVLSDDRPPVALLVDDFGYNIDLAGRIANLDLPLTWAVLPYLEGSPVIVKLARERGVPFLLHLPMQAEIDGEDGPFLVGTAMEKARIREVTREAMASLPGISGVNNHRGSRATSDAGTISAVLDVIESEKLFYVDSRTSSESLGYYLASKRGLPAAYNCVFIDNEADVQSMKEKLTMVVAHAHRKGWALAICHVRPRTVEFLEELAWNRPEDIRLVTVPELISILGAR